MNRYIQSAVLLIVCVYLGCALLLYMGQRELLYFPTAIVEHPYEEILFARDEESIRIILLNRGNESAILYFGGNAEAVAYSAAELAASFPKQAVYLVNYRGFGGSSGSPTEQNMFSDARSVFDAVVLKHNSVSVVGRSIGSGVAAQLASERDVDKLVLVTPFDSIQSIAQDSFPIFPISLILKDKFDSLSRVGAIKAETLVLIAEHDEVIAREYTDRLVAAFPSSQISVELIQQSGHNNVSQFKRYYQSMREFLMKDKSRYSMP